MFRKTTLWTSPDGKFKLVEQEAGWGLYHENEWIIDGSLFNENNHVRLASKDGRCADYICVLQPQHEDNASITFEVVNREEAKKKLDRLLDEASEKKLKAEKEYETILARIKAFEGEDNK